MTISLDVALTGSISLSVPKVNFHIWNPGSNHRVDSLDATYPWYDEVLGTLNIFSLPTLQKSYYRKYGTGTKDNYVPGYISNSYRFTGSTKYVLNPASKLQVQDVRVALLAKSIDGRALKPGGIISSTFSVIESIDVTDGRTVYITPLVDLACLNDFYAHITAQGNLAINADDSKFRIRYVFNLKPIGSTDSTQNVLFVVTYPLQAATLISGNFPIGLVPFNSDVICNKPIPTPMLTSEISTFCNSQIYKEHRFFRLNDSENQASTSDLSGNITLAPNPAEDRVNISYRIMKDGSQVKITVTDFQGKTMLVPLERSKRMQGVYYYEFDTSKLNAGIYHVIVLTPEYKEVKRLIIKR